MGAKYDLWKDFEAYVQKEETNMTEITLSDGRRFKLEWFNYHVPFLNNNKTYSFHFSLRDFSVVLEGFNDPGFYYTGTLVPISKPEEKLLLRVDTIKEYISQNFSQTELDELYKFLYNSHNCRIR